MVVPGLYGFVSATKWITRLTLTTYAADTAYWTERELGRPTRRSRSQAGSTPRSRCPTLKAGRTVIGGVAWAQHRGVGKVEVQLDDGPWQKATLGPDAGDRLLAPVVPPVGRQARPAPARRARHRPQPATCRPPSAPTPFPDGSSGIQEIVVLVA